MEEIPVDYEVLGFEEELDVKPDIEHISSQIEYLKEEEELFDDSESGAAQSLTDIRQRIHIIEGRLDDLEEKIEQKFQTIMRKQDNSFAIISTKLDLLQKSLNRSPPQGNFSSVVKKVSLVPQRVLIPKPAQDTVPVPRKIQVPVAPRRIPMKRPATVIYPPMRSRIVRRRINPVPSLPPMNEVMGPTNNLNPDEILRSRPLVKTLTDMLCFEKSLEDISYRDSVLMNIKMIGGNSMQSEIGNILKSLLSNLVQANYSFKGAKGKDSFNTTQTWDVVRECVQDRYPNATIEEIKKGVSDLLRNAPGKLRSMESALKNVSEV